MNDFVARLVRWSLRALLLAAGLVLFLSLLAAALLLALVWGARALWARLTGRPVMPWSMRFDPRRSWSSMQRGGARWGAAAAREGDSSPRPGARMHVLPGADEVVDVQPRESR